MTSIVTDEQAWAAYPHHRLFFNKLWVSELLGHVCGPAGIQPPSEDYYIVRPIYNLYGMGTAVKCKRITDRNYGQIEPGYFWQEMFKGDHLSVDYIYDGSSWNQSTTVLGKKPSLNFFKWESWERVNQPMPLPSILGNFLEDVKHINIEFIGDKIIEVHLRPNPDFTSDWGMIIPIWSSFIDPDAGLTIGSFKQKYKDFVWVPDNECHTLKHWLNNDYRIGYFAR